MFSYRPDLEPGPDQEHLRTAAPKITQGGIFAVGLRRYTKRCQTNLQCENFGSGMVMVHTQASLK